MIYPSVGQYTEAIKLAEQSPEDYFATMTTLRPVLGADGNPVMSSGNFAVVFKMQDQNNGKIYALKCFTRDQEGRNESYRLIADELQYVESEYLTKIQYLEKELFVDTGTDDTEFPVLLMDWVEGETLDKYIRKNIDDKYSLSMLAFRFSRLAMWLMPQPFAHGDLKPDNIIVRKDGSLTLVDYDGMYVPTMKGQKSRELGSPDFRHPMRTEDDFDEHIDDFSLSTIMLSLKAIALQPSLLEEYGASDRLLFSQNDYRKISECKFLDAVKNLMQDSELTTLLSLFFITLTQNNLTQVSFRLLSLEKPKKEVFYEEILSTEVTDEDIANGVEDEFGVVYSKDGKRLLQVRGNKEFESYSYSIKEGTKIICDEAFIECYLLYRVSMPDTVTTIGCRAFKLCINIQEINLSKSLYNIEEEAFFCCRELKNIAIPNSLRHIGRMAFYDCKRFINLYIPKSLINIEEGAFSACYIKTITVDINNPIYDSRENCNAIIQSNSDKLVVGCYHSNILNSIKCIGKNAFYHSNLKEIRIPNSVTVIEDYAFVGSDVLSIRQIIIPNSVTHIGNYAFSGFVSLFHLTLSTRLISIGEGTFSNCPYLVELILPNTLTTIGRQAFEKCSNLRTIFIPKSVVNLGEEVFSQCSNLRTIEVDSKNQKYDSRNNCNAIIETLTNTLIAGCMNTVIPDTVTKIGKAAFSIIADNNISIPDSVTIIDDRAFQFSLSLTSITLPNSIKYIGKDVFIGCINLKSIIIPLGSRKQFEQMLPSYKFIHILKEI